MITIVLSSLVVCNAVTLVALWNMRAKYKEADKQRRVNYSDKCKISNELIGDKFKISDLKNDLLHQASENADKLHKVKHQHEVEVALYKQGLTRMSSELNIYRAAEKKRREKKAASMRAFRAKKREANG